MKPLLFMSLPNPFIGEGSYKQILVQSLGLEFITYLSVIRFWDAPHQELPNFRYS